MDPACHWACAAAGASAVAIGRPSVWGLAAGGAKGVQSVYDFLSVELRNTMMLSGVGTIAEIRGQKVQVAAVSRGIRSFTTTPYVFTPLDRARQDPTARSDARTPSPGRRASLRCR